MAEKAKSIPLRSLPAGYHEGILVGRMSSNEIPLEEASQSHRHDFHFFIVLEEGTASFEIDFKKYRIRKSSIFYIHPNQVHRFLKTSAATICGLLIKNDKLHPEYLHLLEEIVPAKPMTLSPESLSLITETASLCIKSFNRQKDRLYRTLLRDNCNALVALMLSEYMRNDKPIETLSRFEIITKAFKQALEHQFATLRRAGNYAKVLNISTPYLNECVKNITGHPVSQHIQQRVVLEAKRLLYHSDKSVKEIAAELGYDDYPYFSRLFSKIAGMSPIAFRNRNRD